MFLFTSQAALAAAPKVIELPQPRLKSDVSLEEAIFHRRSVRDFRDQKLTLNQISQLFWAAQGVTDQKSGHRSAPSAGATYPLEIYGITGEGVYHYHPATHDLIMIKGGEYRTKLSRAASGQPWVRQVPLDIVIAAVYERTTVRYGDQAKMYVYLEAGHVAQNLLLQAVALGLGAVPVGAVARAEVAEILDLPANAEALYIIPIGYQR